MKKSLVIQLRPVYILPFQGYDYRTTTLSALVQAFPEGRKHRSFAACSMVGNIGVNVK
jgi:hypothetical protein